MISNLRTLVPLLAVTAALLAGCAGRSSAGLAKTGAAVQVQSTLPEPDFAGVDTGQREYRLGPLDALAISVFGAPELERNVTVDTAGTISLPLIGQLHAAGLTTDELSALIAERLRGRYLRNPQVSVGLTEIRSQRVTVDGAVAQPGIYPIVGRMSLIRAVALARGVTDVAALDKIAVFRTVKNQQMAALFSLKAIREGRLADPEIFANDVVIVGENATRRALKDFSQVLPSLGVFAPIVR
jgi:polysaccharide export outer membrane protein